MEVQNDWNEEQQQEEYNEGVDAENSNNVQTPYDVEEDEEEDDDELDLDAMGGVTSSSHQDNSLLMKFCPHDSSMLYPKEEKSTRTLHYACRRCNFSVEQPAGCSMIYRNVLKKEVKNVLHTVPSAVRDDPTLTRSRDGSNSCEVCGCTEAVFFHSDTGQSDSLALIFVCCNPQCDHKWVR